VRSMCWLLFLLLISVLALGIGNVENSVVNIVSKREYEVNLASAED